MAGGGAGGLVLPGGGRGGRPTAQRGSGGPAITTETGTLAEVEDSELTVDPETIRRARQIATRLAVPRPRRDATARRGTGELASLRYRGGSDDIDLDRTVAQLIAHPLPDEDDIIVRERVRTRRSVLLLVDVSGSMRGERVRTAAATVGALAAELARDDLSVVAFWSDAAILSRLGQHVPASALLDKMLRIPARGLTNVAFPLQVALRELARIPARDARAMLLSDCVHNAGPDPRPFAARLPRLDVLLDTSGEQDPELARELARLGRGRLRRIRTYTDVAPALGAIFTDLKEPAVSVVVVATITPRPEHHDEVVAAYLAVIPQVHAEDGCELYALHQTTDRLVMIEKWASRQALDAHIQGAALAALSPRLAGKTTGPAQVVLLDAVPAGEPAKGQL